MLQLIAQLVDAALGKQFLFHHLVLDGVQLSALGRCCEGLWAEPSCHPAAGPQTRGGPCCNFSAAATAVAAILLLATAYMKVTLGLSKDANKGCITSVAFVAHAKPQGRQPGGRWHRGQAE